TTILLAGKNGVRPLFFRRGPNGEVIANKFSGYYWKSWTPALPSDRSRAKELGATMSMEDIVADRLGKVVADGFDIFKISKEARDIYQDPNLSLAKDLDIALFSLMAMVEGPEFEMTEKEFYDFLSNIRQM
ncbi:hypothetical protein, partial [Pseudomonas edaphica]|uniref:hypothetical protein n=1 Tax=Pseudomonas edaphica TaxID=2006980 RepID=UPI001F447C06